MSKENNKFPVLLGHRVHGKQPGFPSFVRWSELNERQAQINHSQSLGRLAERGGLSPAEIVGNINGIGWSDLSSVTEDQMHSVLESIAIT